MSCKTLEKIRVAVIGCGRISIMHLESIKHLDGLELVAVCDNKKDRVEKTAEKYKVKAYYDYQEMIDNERLDCVHICLPHYLHVPVSIYAMERNVNVLCEKPMSIDYESAEKAVLYAQKQNVLYGIISQCRYNNSARFVKKALEDGKLGKIISASSILTWKRDDEYYSESDWKGTWDKEGGGVVIDQATHSIDLVNWLINSEVESLSCSMSNRGHNIVCVEDSAEGLIKYKNGVKYGFYCMNNYGVDEPIEIKLYCEKGKVVFGYDDAYIYYNDGRKEEAHQDVEEKISGGKDYWGFQHIRQIEQFYKAVRGEETLDISGKEGLKTHKLIMDLYSQGGMRK